MKQRRKAIITTVEACFWLSVALSWGFVSDLPHANRLIASLMYTFPAYVYGKKARRQWVKAAREKRIARLKGRE